jgi:hypothetical protein
MTTGISPILGRSAFSLVHPALPDECAATLTAALTPLNLWARCIGGVGDDGPFTVTEHDPLPAGGCPVTRHHRLRALPDAVRQAAMGLDVAYWTQVADNAGMAPVEDPTTLEAVTTFSRWEHGDYIDTHTDDQPEIVRVLSISLSRGWTVEFGGLFGYETTDGSDALVVPFNSAVVFDPCETTHHWVTPVETSPQIRMTMTVSLVRVPARG